MRTALELSACLLRTSWVAVPAQSVPHACRQQLVSAVRRLHQQHRRSVPTDTAVVPARSAAAGRAACSTGSAGDGRAGGSLLTGAAPVGDALQPAGVGLSAALHLRRVELDIQGTTHTLQVEEGDTILQTALDNGIELSHDCKMGVCMTCPAKLVRAGAEPW